MFRPKPSSDLQARIERRFARGQKREAELLSCLAKAWQDRTSEAPRHGLDGHLVLSLTSYPPRFSTLEPTLKSLLLQSIRPDVLVLWIAERDADQIPRSIKILESDGLVIQTCDDLLSYKKIIPALHAYPESFIVTADDDVCYPSTWLDGLVSGFDPDNWEVLCWRGHSIELDETGNPLAYVRWRRNVAATGSSARIFPTGVGGVLYRPGVLHRDVLNKLLFTELCPTSDDIWLYWMALRNGGKFRKIGPVTEFRPWLGSQRVGLFMRNVRDGDNDQQFQNMIRKYGRPTQWLEDRWPSASTTA